MINHYRESWLEFETNKCRGIKAQALPRSRSTAFIKTRFETGNDSGLWQLHKPIGSLIIEKDFQLLAMESSLIVTAVLHKAYIFKYNVYYAFIAG